MNFLGTDRFKQSFPYYDYIIIQIDTLECDHWKEGLKTIGSDASVIKAFIDNVVETLIKKIGLDFYNANREKIIFAITVHEIECWLLPFVSTKKSEHSKMVTCSTALENIANAKGFSIHQKNYESGKHYSDFAEDMRRHSELMKKSLLNPSLKIFIENLQAKFPPPIQEMQA